LLLSRGLVPFLLFLLFEHGFVNIARDRFGDGFVGDCGCAREFCYLNDKFAVFEA
jgi:hypothetical protein